MVENIFGQGTVAFADPLKVTAEDLPISSVFARPFEMFDETNPQAMRIGAVRCQALAEILETARKGRIQFTRQFVDYFWIEGSSFT